MVMEGFQWFTENEPENSTGMPVGTQQYQYRHFPGHDISIAPNNSVLARPAVPVLDEDSCIPEAGLATVNVLDQKIGENNPGKTLTGENGTAGAANSLKEDLAEELAALFDSVPMEVLEKMFPADGKWKGWANHAKRNGLAEARAGRRLFNPYKAGIWFLSRGIANWDLARCHRKLADNLPARSREKKYLLDGNLE
ncbi:hypothetical protein [Nitrosovibrio sp. Nv6]|uniref:hypothetical protein n=1 Tax=Nitrosovibrio sp. Nv6 TaxID=1855340 RepID=UPI00115FB41A|nr:hypothetical protein [Nitrosovibrio sp. Nv6]